MIRRVFILSSAGAVAAVARPARAQRPADRPVRIGLLRAAPLPHRWLEAFRQGLAAKGYVEGRNVVFVPAFGEGDSPNVADLATALVAKGVDLIVSEGGTVTHAARTASGSIPILMASSPDPVRLGLVQSLSRPGGNVTGLVSQPIELTVKLQELVREIVPGVPRVALIMPRIAWDAFGDQSMAAARALGQDIVHIELDLADIDAAFRRAVAERVQAAVVRGRPFFSLAQAKVLVERAAAHRLPAVYETRDFAELGGLVALGVDMADQYRRLADYVDRIVTGSKPADLPVEQPTQFELVVNRGTARALGIAIPPTILARADEVIE
jgi:putative ABC transport system substrate-binding protein